MAEFEQGLGALQFAVLGLAVAFVEDAVVMELVELGAKLSRPSLGGPRGRFSLGESGPGTGNIELALIEGCRVGGDGS